VEAVTMKGVWTLAVGLSLGWLAARGAAQERPSPVPQALPAGFSDPPAASLGRPISGGAETGPDRRLIADSQLRTAAYPQRPIASTESTPRPRGPAPGPLCLGAPAPDPLANVPPPPDPDLARPGLLQPVSHPTPPAYTPASEFATVRGDSGPLGVAAAVVASPPPASPPLPAAECCSISAALCEPGGPEASCFYTRDEYLLWWFQGMRLPPLVTTGPPASFGILGAPGTVVLFGGSTVDDRDHSGGRFTVGFRCDPCKPVAFETTGFFLGPRGQTFTANSDTNQLLARPFFNLNAGREDSEATAFPGLAAGGIGVSTSSRLWGLEENLRFPCCCGTCCDVDFLIGPRYLDLSEDLQILESLRVLQDVPNTPAVRGSNVRVFDSFATRNQFTGLQLGTDVELRKGPCFLDLRLKVVVGDVHEVVTINGAQAITPPVGGTTLFQGGLLALPSNIGRFSRDRFAAAPELGVNLGCALTARLRLLVGYDVLYLSNVVRPGDQIDRVLDVTQIPNANLGGARPTGTGRPTVLFRESDFWAQGFNCGLEWRY
jgi:hypothetical protein